VAGIREALASDLSYVVDAKYASDAVNSGASAVMVGRDWSEVLPAVLIRVDDPEKAFYSMALAFAPPAPEFPPGIHSSAVVADEARLGDGVHIGPQVVIESGVSIGARSIIGPGTHVGTGTVIGEDCRIHALVSVREYVTPGNRVIIHSNTTVGSDGFAYYTDADGVNQKIPQFGTVVIEDDVEIGSNVAIDRARFGKTLIGKNVKIDNLVQVAHNCIIGDHSMIVSMVGLSGSTILGHHVLIGGQVGTAGHLSVGDNTVLAARTGVTKSLEGGQMYAGFPARPALEEKKGHAHVARIPSLRAKIKELEKRIEDLEPPA
jgi:UDP-3-O-[3-hydroxymyristoyl] glucosamine N-acyltransferase